MALYDSPVLIELRPLGALPVNLGTGPALPVVVEKTTAGTYTFASFNVPSGRDVTVTLQAPGGGGAGARTGPLPGAGGGGGAACQFVVPAAKWAAGGELVLGAPGTGGAAIGANGTNGSNAEVNMVADLIACQGGRFGNSTANTGGAGGTLTVAAPNLQQIIRWPGLPGTAATASVAGAGGAGGAPGAGAGGAGSGNPGPAGANGAAGRITVQW